MNHAAFTSAHNAHNAQNPTRRSELESDTPLLAPGRLARVSWPTHDTDGRLIESIEIDPPHDGTSPPPRPCRLCGGRGHAWTSWRCGRCHPAPAPEMVDAEVMVQEVPS